MKKDRIFHKYACEMIAGWLVYCFLSTSCLLGAETQSQEQILTSCRSFVQGFYNWYLKQLSHESEGPAFNQALQYRRQVFSRSLFQALKEDYEAQSKVSGVIVGIDFDPFLASQDPAERYVVGKIVIKAGSYWVGIHAIRDDEKSQKPELYAEAVIKDGQWLFINFHYSQNDLLRILKRWREERRKQPDFGLR